MRIPSGLAITLLASSVAFAQAPAAPQTLGQRLAAEKPEITRLTDAFDYPAAQAKAEALIPAAKPAFDKSSVRNLVESTRTYAELCQVYFTAFQATDNNGQWEKGLEYLNKAMDAAKESVENGKGPLTEQRDWWLKKDQLCKDLLDKNADAIKALHAKAKLEDYEQGPMEQVKAWEKDKAEADKWSKFFQYELDMAARNVEDFQKFVTIQDKKIKDQQADIDGYKPHPGDKVKWVDAVISNKSYMEAYPEKADKAALLYRLKVLDPENHKVQNALDVLMGKAVEEKAPAHKKKK